MNLVLYTIYAIVALLIAFAIFDYTAHRIRLHRLRKEAYAGEKKKED